jgi:hypothetical protein
MSSRNHRIAVRPQALPNLGAGFRLVAVGAPLFATMLLVSPSHVLPVLAIVSMAAAGFMAILAWCTAEQAPPDRTTLWDVSGAWALVGFAAGIFSGSERSVALLTSLGP